MITEALRNLIHREVARYVDRYMRRQPCIVSAYNPSQHTVKVLLQPSGTETGWVQVETPQIGLMIAPLVNQPGWLEFHEGDRRAAVFVGSTHNDKNPIPKQIQSGEFYYQNAKGQTIYAKNDGSITTTDGMGGSTAMKAGVVTVTDKNNSTLIMDGAGNITGTAATKITFTAPTISLVATTLVTFTTPLFKIGGVQMNIP